MTASHDFLLSVIIPVFNEEEALQDTYNILTQTLEAYRYEVVVTDNGSTDATERIMQSLATRDERWRYIRLSRNFGYQNSLTVALKYASGDAIVTIDADLQDPPEMIADFVTAWQQGYEIVYGLREKRAGESRFRMWATNLALRLISSSSDVPIPVHSSDFRLISRRVRDHFIQMPENNRYLRGLIHWLGFKQKGIPYERRPRQVGIHRPTSASPLFLILFTLDAIFSFSLKPLRAFTVFGVLTTIGSVALIGVYLIASLFGSPPPGIMTLLILMLFQIGMNAVGIGLLGEYVGRSYAETKQRPLYIVDYTLGFADSQAAPAETPAVKPLPHE